MRLSWNEIRARAAAFVREWTGEGYEKGQTQLFYRDFFEIFGIPVRKVASFEEPIKNLGDKRGFIDLFWKGMLLVEQKSAGRDLNKAKQQALDYFPGLKDFELPRYILLSDFQSFELYDLEEGAEIAFPLADLPRYIEQFGFITGVEKRSFRDQDPVNIQAAKLVGKLHDALEESGYTGHDLELFLVRTVFCLFADNTGIFEPRNLFLEFLETRTAADGSDLGGWLSKIFQVLDTTEDRRSTKLDEDLAHFPYINGTLFAGGLRIPAFDSKMRHLLLEACRFDWSGISPAIFGSLFQSVMNRDERRKQGAHYTTEKNILKVIGPLFLDDLWKKFNRLKAHKGTRRRSELQAFHQMLGKMRFFDPACGCGNFLIIAYRELRILEIEILKELVEYERDHLGKFVGRLDIADLSVVNVDQFYGIEIGEFPARIAETALWMMDHIMNNRLSLAFGQNYARIPLEKSPFILHADALETDWAAFLPPRECWYVFGNPPFVGAKYQSAKQREQIQRIAAMGKSGGTLDYVAAWFIKAGEYIQNSSAHIGFVATNSITQGEQVAQLWRILFGRYGLEISFAHQTFAWGSDARGKANVHVVIIGLTKEKDAPGEKRLFSYVSPKDEPHESVHAALSPYLFGAENLNNRHIVVREAATAINRLPKLIIGSKPIDGGHYIFTEKEKEAFLAEEPGAGSWLRPYVGAQEFLHGGWRWILALSGATPEALKKLPKVREKISAVRKVRLASRSRSTRLLAETPALYHVNVIPAAPFLVIPKVSSERREYVPFGWLEPPVIPSDLVFVLENATKAQFALLTSAMHMSWLRHMGGRLESRYRYSIGLVYNTFPTPVVKDAQLAKLEPLAQAVLDARNKYPDSTLSNLYDPDLMPVTLRKAHQALDRAVDRLYRKEPFTSDRDRVEHLLMLYDKMTGLQFTPEPGKPRKSSRKPPGQKI